MAGFGYSGQQAIYGPNKRGIGGGATPSTSVMDKYNTTTAQGAVPQNITDQMAVINKLPTGYTPEQQLAIRNRIAATDTAQAGGGLNRISEIMAARGLSGSGAETGAMGGYLRDVTSARQNALSNLDLSNNQLDLSNRYNQAGMLNQLAGMGEQGRQFGANSYNDMFKYGTSFDEQKRQADQGRSDYYKQLEEWKNQLNNPVTNNNYTVNRSRS